MNEEVKICEKDMKWLKELFETKIDAMDKATNLANENLKIRLESMNEFRSQMKDQATTFATKVDVENLKERLDIGKGKSMGLSQGWIILIGLTSLISVILSIVIALMSFFK